MSLKNEIREIKFDRAWCLRIANYRWGWWKEVVMYLVEKAEEYGIENPEKMVGGEMLIHTN